MDSRSIEALVSRLPRFTWQQADRFFKHHGFVVSAYIALTALPSIAGAHIGRCSNGSLTAADESVLLESARQTFPTSSARVGLAVSNLCGSTSAEVTTERVADRPGVSHWWVAKCEQDTSDTREWACLSLKLQEVERVLVIRGIKRKLSIRFDAATVPEAVDSVANRALSLYSDAKSELQYCGSDSVEGKIRWMTLQKQHPLRESGMHISVTAPQYATLGSVRFEDVTPPDDIKIEIRLPIVGPDQQDPRPHHLTDPSQKCGVSGTDTKPVDCSMLANSIPTALEPPCWQPMAP